MIPITNKLLKFSGYTEEPLPQEPEPKRQKSLPPSNNLLRCLMLTPLPHTRQVYEGERIEIKIRLDVNPEPIIKWYKNGEELKPSHRITIDYYGGVACLTYNAVIAGDSGHYRVHVVNAKGSVTSEMDFTVLPGQHPLDQPDISGIVPLTLAGTTFSPSTPGGSSTIRLHTENSTGMYLQSNRPHRPGVWTPRQQSEPPLRAVRPPSQQSVIYMQPAEQQTPPQSVTSQHSQQIILQQSQTGQRVPVQQVQQIPIQQIPVQQTPQQQIPPMWQPAPPGGLQSSQTETYHQSMVQSSAMSPTMTSSLSEISSVRRPSTERPPSQSGLPEHSFVVR